MPTMSSDAAPPSYRPSYLQVLWRHVLLVVVCVVAGALAGWGYAASSQPVYTSTVRVLINPSAGSPFSPTPASVRQDELTSLETEAQVARSAEVLDAVSSATQLDTARLSSNTQVTVPPNTQILEISYSATDRRTATRVAGALAQSYLKNRSERSEQVKDARIEQVKTATIRVVDDLRTATTEAQQGTAAERAFQARLADALRNELVSLRAQRSSLESVQVPVGTVISPASNPPAPGPLRNVLMTAVGGLVGLVLGYLLAMVLERLRGTVRHPGEVEAQGLDVIAALPPAGWPARIHRTDRSDAIASGFRRLRAHLLADKPRPSIITVAPASPGGDGFGAAVSIAESFARAGHRVVLIGHDHAAPKDGVKAPEDGVASAFRHSRLDVHDLLQPTVEPMLSLLSDSDLTSESRELLTSEGVRNMVSPLVEEGYLVVIGLREVDSAEGDAYLAAADVTLVVVVARHTRRADLRRVLSSVPESQGRPAAFVVGPHDIARATRRPDAPADSELVDTRAPDPAETGRTAR